MELEISRTDRVLALGRDPMKSASLALELKDVPSKVCEFQRRLWWGEVAGRRIPVAGTYFPGNNRHRGFGKIAEDIRWILKQVPLV
jgi:hypothetical protein